jgi:hypothetical protein
MVVLMVVMGVVRVAMMGVIVIGVSMIVGVVHRFSSVGQNSHGGAGDGPGAIAHVHRRGLTVKRTRATSSGTQCTTPHDSDGKR